MNELYPKLVSADILVFATPVYVDGISGPMKNLMDRMIPVIQPFFELRDGHCRHLTREGHSESAKLVLVSNCGFWEMDNFDPLVVHMKAACKNISRKFAGALLRPHGAAIQVLLEMGMSLDDLFDAAREAGRQLVRDGEMSPENLETISRELMPLDAYMAGSDSPCVDTGSVHSHRRWRGQRYRGHGISLLIRACRACSLYARRLRHDPSTSRLRRGVLSETSPLRSRQLPASDKNL